MVMTRTGTVHFILAVADGHDIVRQQNHHTNEQVRDRDTGRNGQSMKKWPEYQRVPNGIEKSRYSYRAEYLLLPIDI